MSYRIGTGKRDITGSAAELGMLGMADADQKTAGILSRLFARTFVIEEQGNHVAIVTADIMSCTLAVKEEIVRRLGDLEELKDDAGNPIFTRILPTIAVFIIKYFTDDRTQIENRVKSHGYRSLIRIGNSAGITDIFCNRTVDIVSWFGAGSDCQLIKDFHITRFTEICLAVSVGVY